MKRILVTLMASLFCIASFAQTYTDGAESATTAWTISPALARYTSSVAPTHITGGWSYKSTGFYTPNTYEFTSPALVPQNNVSYVQDLLVSCKMKCNLPAQRNWTLKLYVKDITANVEYQVGNYGNPGPVTSATPYPQNIAVYTALDVTHLYVGICRITSDLTSTVGTYWVMIDDLSVGWSSWLLSSAGGKYPALSISYDSAYKVETSGSTYETYAQLKIAKPAQGTPVPSTMWPSITVKKIDKSTGEVVSNDYIAPSISYSTSATTNYLGEYRIDDETYKYEYWLSHVYDGNGYMETRTVGMLSFPSASSVAAKVSRSSTSTSEPNCEMGADTYIYRFVNGLGNVYFYNDPNMTSTYNGGSNYWNILLYSGQYSSKINAVGSETDQAVCE